MSTEVDQRIVEMKFNNKNFEKNVSTTMNTLQKFKESLNFKGATKSLEELEKAGSKFTLDPLREAAEKVELSFDAMSVVAIRAITRVVDTAFDAGVRLVKSLSVDNIAAGWAKFEQKTTSVGTLISQGYDMSVVDKQLSKLNWFTDETSYNFTDMVENIAKFTASGKDLEDSVVALEGIANWAALSGQNATTASRAMYQLSQAMGAGAMRKQDWMSIQNASMDTVEFRQHALDAAVAIGTLEKTTEGLYHSLVNTDADAFTISQFADHLTQDAWFTSDVMMKVYKDYASAVDKIYTYASVKGITASQAIEEMSGQLDEFAVKAFRAAQEARTWTDVVGSVKDAVSTGWMNTFELIFGNYEEAKVLFTDLANEMYDVFAEGGNTRNANLTEGLTSGLSQLLKRGVPSLEIFRDALFSAGKASGVLTDTKISKYNEDFAASLKEGWVTSELLEQALAEIVITYGTLTDEQLKAKDFTDEQITSLRILNDEYSSGAIDVEKYADALGKTSGRENLVQALWNLWDALFSVDEETEKAVGLFAVIKEAFGNVFPSLTGDRILDFTERLQEFTKKLIPTTETAEKLSTVFQGLFSIFDIAKQIFGAVWRSLSPVFGLVKNGISSFIDFLVPIAETITGFANAAREGDTFYNTIQNVVGKVEELVGKFTDSTFFTSLNGFINGIITSIKKLLGISDEVTDETTLEKPLGPLAKIWQLIKNIWSVVKGLIDSIANGLLNIDFTKFTSIFERLLEIVGNGLGKVGELIGTVIGWFSDLVKSGDPEKVLDLFNTSMLTVFAISLKTLMEQLTSITDVFDSISGKMESEKLINFAKALLMLSVALLILSTIPSDKIVSATMAMEAVVLMMIQLEKGLAQVGKKVDFSSKKTGVAGAAFAMLEIAGAMLLLAIAFKQLSKLSWDEITKGLVSFGACMIIMTSIIKTMSKIQGDAKNTAKSIGTMITMALSMVILAFAISKLGQMKTEEMFQGLAGFGTAMLVMTMVIKIIGFMESDAKNTKKAISSMITMALSMLILAFAISKLGQMKTGEMFQGLVGFAAAMLVMTMVIKIISSMESNAKNTKKAISSMITIALSMLIMAFAISKLGQMKTEEMFQGLVGFAGTMLVMTMVIKIISQLEGSTAKIVSTIASLILASVAMLILAKALQSFGSMDWGTIGRGLIAMGGALLELIIVMTVLSALQQLPNGNITQVAASLVLVSSAMLILASAIKVLGSMTLDQIGLAMIGLAGGLAAVVGIAVIMSQLHLTDEIFALAGSLLLMAVAAGIVAGAIALLAMFGTAAGAAILGLVKIIPTIASALAEGLGAFAVTLMGVLPGILALVSAAIAGLALVIIERTPDIMKAIGVLLEAALELLIKDIPLIVAAVGMILAEILLEIAKMLPDIIEAGIQIIEALIRGFGEANYRIIVAAIEMLLTFINGLADAIETYTPQLVAAVSKLVKAIIHAFVTGFKGSWQLIKDLGKELIESNFFKSIKEKIDDVKTIAGDIISGFVDGIKNGIQKIVDTASEIATNFTDTLKSWFKIESPSKVMRDEVGRYIVQGIAEGIKKDMSAEEAAKKKAENITKAFKETLDNLDLDTKTTDLEYQLWESKNKSASDEEKYMKRVELQNQKIANQAERMMTAEAEYKAKLKEFGEDSEATREAYNKFLEEQLKARSYTEELFDIQKAYLDVTNKPKAEYKKGKDGGSFFIKGIANGISADMSAEDAAAQKAENIVAAFQDIFDDFQKKIDAGDINYQLWEVFNPDASETDKALAQIESLVNKAENLAGIANSYQGIYQAMVGKFGADSKEAIAAYQQWQQSVIDLAEVDGKLREMEGTPIYAEAMKKRAEGSELLANAIDEESETYRRLRGYGAFEPITVEFDPVDEATLAALGSDISADVDSYLGQFLHDVEVDFQEELPSVISGASTAVGNASKALGEVGAASFTDEYLQGIDSTFRNYFNSLQDKIFAGDMSKALSWESVIRNWINALPDALKDEKDTMLRAIDTMHKTYLSAYDEKRYDAEYAKQAEATFRNYFNTIQSLMKSGDISGADYWVGVARNWLYGLDRGLVENWDSMLSTIDNLSKTLVKRTEDDLDINSPSKVSEEIGRYYVMGFAKGLMDRLALVVKNANLISDEAVDIFTGIIARIDQILNGDFDFDPVISPVLDLSNVTANANELARLLDSTGSYELAARSMSARDSGGYSSMDGPTQLLIDNLGQKIDGLAYSLDDLRSVVESQGSGDINIEFDIDGRRMADATVEDYIAASRANGTPFYVEK